VKVTYLQIIIVRHNHIRNILYIVHNAALPLFMANTHTRFVRSPQAKTSAVPRLHYRARRITNLLERIAGLSKAPRRRYILLFLEVI